MPEHPPVSEEDRLPQNQPERGWGCLQWAVIVVVIIIAAGLAIPAFNGVSRPARQAQAMNNCRQIILCLKAYAEDHEGRYPEGATANDVFRQFFKAGLLEDERLFTSPASPYEGDNHLGEPPDYAQGLEKGENHWAMTKGLTASAPGEAPLVFENPAVNSWPPLWDTRLEGVAKPGRVWKGGKIAVGRVDGSVSIEKLKEGEPMATLAPIKDSKNLFELAGPHEVLDVAK